MNDQDPLIQRLADANPVPEERVEGSHRSSAAEEMLSRITEGRPRLLRRFLLDRRSAAFTVAATGLVVVVVLAATLLLLGRGSAPATAAELLLRTAAIAGGREPALEEGAYVYSRSKSQHRITGSSAGEAWSAALPAEEEIWVAPDGSGRIRTVFGPHRFFGDRDRVRWEAQGSPPFADGISDDTFPAGTLPYEDVEGLPTQDARLLAYLRKQVASEDLPSDVAVFMRIAELLARGDAPSSVRATLFRVASQLPGIELAGGAVDPAGRPGVGVSLTFSDSGADVRVVMIFDDETSLLLGQEHVLLERASWVDADPGTRLSFTAYLASDRTHSVGNRPGS